MHALYPLLQITKLSNMHCLSRRNRSTRRRPSKSLDLRPWISEAMAKYSLRLVTMEGKTRNFVFIVFVQSLAQCEDTIGSGCFHWKRCVLLLYCRTIEIACIRFNLRMWDQIKTSSIGCLEDRTTHVSVYGVSIDSGGVRWTLLLPTTIWDDLRWPPGLRVKL